MIQRSRIIASSLRKCDSLLFVYGTLRPGVGVPMARWLARVALRVGAARTPGRLYDLGPYPGMTLPRRSREWVHGEVYRVRDIRTLRALDRYEADGSGIRRAPFVRVSRPVEVNGKWRSGWVYLYRRSTLRATRVVRGDYLDVVRSNRSRECTVS